MAGSERGLVGVLGPGACREERTAVWMRCRPGGLGDPPLHTGLRLTLINMYARLGSLGPCEACQTDIRCLVFGESEAVLSSILIMKM